MIIECYATNEEIEALEEGQTQLLTNVRENEKFDLQLYKILVSTDDYLVKASKHPKFIHVTKKEKRLENSDTNFNVIP